MVIDIQSDNNICEDRLQLCQQSSQLIPQPAWRERASSYQIIRRCEWLTDSCKQFTVSFEQFTILTDCCRWNILMGYKKALTPLPTHWSYIFLALTHWYTSQTSLAWEKSWSSTTIRWISWLINSLWPNDAIWQYRSRSTLAQVMGCCRTNVD